jgi:uncharacterized protein YbjT (DUF2867 family)
VHFDWLDEGSYPAALAGADAVYLVSPHLNGTVTDALGQVRKFVDSLAGSGVGQIVLLSSFGVEQAPADDSMRQIELLVEGAGMAWTILRPAAFMQNFAENHWSGAARRIRERGEVALQFGEHPVSYVSADDIAEVAAAVLTGDGHAGHGYTLTGPEALTLSEVADYISAAAGRPVRYADPGPDATRQAVLDSGATPGYAEYVSQMYQFAMTSDAMAAVTGDVAAVTGHPATPFAEFAAGAAGAWIP